MRKPVGSSRDRIINDFSAHKTDADGAERMREIREKCGAVALIVSRLVPKGREREKAIGKLEEAMFWANAGIARRYGKA